MATNLYLSNIGDTALELEVVNLGPDDFFETNSYFTGLVASVAAAQVNQQVLTIARTPALGIGRPPLGMAELRVTSSGQYAGSLVLLLDGSGRPVKANLYWMVRGPGPAMGPMVSDRDPHSIGFETPSQRIHLTVTGKAAGVFDDLYLEVLVQPTNRWVSVAAARDGNLNRVVLLAVDGADRPHLLAAPYGAPTPQFTEIPLPAANDDPPSHHCVIFDNAWDHTQPIWIGGLTATNKLWLLRTDGTSREVLELQPPGSNLASLVVSDAFSVGNAYCADLFLTIQDSDHDYRLYSRVVNFGATPSLAGSGWTDWGAVLCRKPSYVRCQTVRYLCAPRPGVVFGVNMQYASASINASDWGAWHSTTTLPGDGTTNNAAIFTWDAKESPQKEAAIAFRASDGLLYVNTFNSSDPNWTARTYKPAGDTLVPVDGMNFVPLLFRDADSGYVRCTRWAVKEMCFGGGGLVGAPATPPCFTGFHYDNPDPVIPSDRVIQYAAWQGVNAADVTLTPIP